MGGACFFDEHVNVYSFGEFPFIRGLRSQKRLMAQGKDDGNDYTQQPCFFLRLR